MTSDDNSVFMNDPQFPDNLPASAVWDAHPSADSRALEDLSTDELRAVCEWHVAELAADPMFDDVLELVEERPDDPMLIVELPEHNTTPADELDALDTERSEPITGEGT